MPTSVVKTKKDEKRWKKARDLASRAGKGENYAYIMGIYNRMVEKSTAYSGTGSRTGSPGNYDYKYTQSNKRTFKVGDENKIGGIKLSGQGSQWVFVHRSSKKPGMWQASFFDQAVPNPGQNVPDTQHRSAQEAVDAVMQMGYEAVNIIEKGTFEFSVLGARIFKATGDPYDGPGTREGTPGNYTYIYDDDEGGGKEEKKEEPKEDGTQDAPSLEDQAENAKRKQQTKELNAALINGLASQVSRILDILAPGSGAMLSAPLGALYGAKTDSDRKKAKAEIDDIREKIRNEKKDFASKDRVRKMSDGQIQANLDRIKNRPGLDKEAEKKQRRLLQDEYKRRGLGTKKKEPVGYKNPHDKGTKKKDSE